MRDLLTLLSKDESGIYGYGGADSGDITGVFSDVNGYGDGYGDIYGDGDGNGNVNIAESLAELLNA